MIEATASLRLIQLRASMALATQVRARQVALNLTKHRLRAQGFRVSQFSHRDLVLKAEEYLAQHRAQLVADAKADVERWRLQGFFGKRFANINTDAQGGKR
jgi:hypothetical protein